MIAFANKTALPLALMATSFDAATVNTEYQTPELMRQNIGDLSRLTYLKGFVQAGVKLNQQATQGSITLTLKAGENIVASKVLALNGKSSVYWSEAVDITQVSGSAGLSLHAKVDAAAQASTTAEIDGALVVEHPIVVNG